MKKIKLLVITWIIALLSISTALNAQDTIKGNVAPPFDTLTFGIEVKTDPVTVTVNTEKLENNEVLQKVVESLDTNLSNLNQTLLNQDPVFTDLDLLFYYSINLDKISDKEKVIDSVWWTATAFFLMIILLFIIYKKHLYFTKKRKTYVIYLTIVGLVLFGYVMPTLMKILLIPDYSLWQNVSKLF